MISKPPSRAPARTARVRTGRPGPRALLVLLLIPAVAGCYRYEPLQSPEPPAPGTDVRIRFVEIVEESGADWTRRTEQVSTLDGKVVDWQAEAASFSIPARRNPFDTSARQRAARDTVTIPVDRIRDASRRELMLGRTVALASGISVGAILLGLLLLELSSASGEEPPPI